MAKGDHSRAQNKIDEQQKLAQGYLTGVQSQLGGQYGAMSDFYFGGTPQRGTTFGVGTTVPQYSSYNQPSFQGNETDTPYTPTFGGTQTGAGTDYQSTFDQMFPGSSLSPQMLAARENDLTAAGFRLLGPNARGERSKIQLPNGQVIDVIGGAGSGQNRKQWLGTGGGGGGFGGGGGLPGMAMQDYGQLQGMFGDTYGDFHGLYGQIPGMFGGFLGSAQNMAQTGGLSEGDKANLRARAISPIRSVYSQGVQNLDRQRALQGGYSPGYGTLLGRFNREQGQLTSDATTNAEAAIAEMVQRGKLGGLSAWGSGLGSEVSAMEGALGGQLGSAKGATDLYGTQPGMAKLFGDQALQAMDQQLRAAGLQNQLGLGIMDAQIASSKIPGNYQEAMGNIKDTMGVAKNIGGVANPMMDWWNNRGNKPGFESGVPDTGDWYGNPVGYNPDMDPSAWGNPYSGYYGTPVQNPDMDPTNWGYTNTGDSIRTDLGPGPFGGPMPGMPYASYPSGDMASYSYGDPYLGSNVPNYQDYL